MIGNATAANVLDGKTFTNSSTVGATGTMPNKGAVTGSITASGGSYTIPAGYHNGSGKVTGPTLAALVGTSVTLTSNANLLTGYTAYGKNGVKYTGSMVNRGAWTNTPTTKGKVSIPAGYHNGSGYIDTTEIFNAGVNSASIKTDFISQTLNPGDNTISTNGKARIIAVSFTWGNGSVIWSDGTYWPNISQFRGVESLTNVTENSFVLRVHADLSPSPGSIWIIY